MSLGANDDLATILVEAESAQSVNWGRHNLYKILLVSDRGYMGVRLKYALTEQNVPCRSRDIQCA